MGTSGYPTEQGKFQMKICHALVLASLFVGACAGTSVAQVSFDGKTSSHHSITQTPLVTGAILTGTITAGKSKSVLVIDGMISSAEHTPYISWVLTGSVLVNGLPAATTRAVQTCSGDASGPYAGVAVGCTVNGHWIVDIDALEAANPGCCVKQPLVVGLVSGYGGNLADFTQPVDATLSVTMEKKK
jgi:hypothetical protein